MDRTTFLLRVGIVALVGLAGTAPHLARRGRAVEPVLIRDVSLSLGGATPAPVGDETWLAAADGVRWLAPSAHPAGLGRGASRLGLALAEAARAFPGRDVLLVSDGRATDDAEAAARTLARLGGRLFARPALPPASDVGLLEARAERHPDGVRVRARWGATGAAAVRLVLLRAGRRVASIEARLAGAGRQDALLHDAQAPPGAAAYRLELEALAGTPDDDPGNDALALGVLPQRPAVLVWGTLDVDALRAAAPDVDLRGRVSPDAADLAAADLVLLAGPPFQGVGEGGAARLREFVAAGGTLLAVGGPGAYGAGGWEGSALERDVLALRVRRTPQQGADLVLALDVSGSTHGEPLRALTDAAREALAGLQPGERLAVLPFRGRAALEPLTGGFVVGGDRAQHAAMAAALDALAAGGPTDLVAGLEAAARLLGASPPGRERLLVLLTDGDPHEAPDEAGLSRVGAALKASDVAFGALIVDMPAAVEVLRRHVASRAADVQLLDEPRGLAGALLEQLGRRRAAREQRRGGEPERVETAPGTWADLLPRGWAPAWVHDVEPVEGARLLARTRWRAAAGGEGSLAAERTLGAGRSAALAWGPGAEEDPRAATALLAPLVVRLAGEVERGREAEQDDAGRVRVRLTQAAGQGRIGLLVDGRELEMLEVEPGLFVGLDPCRDALDVRVRGPGFEHRLRLPARPPPEHRGVGPDLESLAALARAGGGRVLGADESPAPRPPRSGAALAPWLLLGACMLLLVERRRA